MRRTVWVLAAIVFPAVFVATPASAQVHFGPQVSLADDADVGLGGRLVAGVPDYTGLEFSGTFDVFFPQGPGDYWELNGNLLHNFELAGTAAVRPYAGGGLNLARFDRGDEAPRGDQTELGLNLVAGTKFATENPATPFVEIRLEVEGGEQVVVTGGLLFP